MANISLVKGTKYRVLTDAYRNPFAGVKGVKPTIPCWIDPGNNEERRILRKGDTLTYIGQRTGWGSDPGQDEIFTTEEGLEGSFFPTGVWGGVDQRLLEAIGGKDTPT